MGYNDNTPQRNKINILKTTIIALAAHRPAPRSRSRSLSCSLAFSLTCSLSMPSRQSLRYSRDGWNTQTHARSLSLDMCACVDTYKYHSHRYRYISYKVISVYDDIMGRSSWIIEILAQRSVLLDCYWRVVIDLLIEKIKTEQLGWEWGLCWLMVIRRVFIGWWAEKFSKPANQQTFIMKTPEGTWSVEKHAWGCFDVL